MTYDKLVSVIIPTFNREKFIEAGVTSIVEQGYENIEIILVDDFSTDDTESIVNKLMQKYSCVIYCKNERRKGPSGARNTGLIRAAGDFIAFLDSDDIWLPNHLERGISFLFKHPDVDVLFGNFSAVDYESGTKLYDFFDNTTTLKSLNGNFLDVDIKVLRDNIFISLVKENFFHLASALIRKETLGGILFDESIQFAEDRDFAIQLSKKARATFAYRVDPIFVLYRHDSNLYDISKIKTQLKVLLSLVYLYKKYLNEYDVSDEEINVINGLLLRRLLSLSYLFRKTKENKQALKCVWESFYYGRSLAQAHALLKVIFSAGVNWRI